MGPWCLAVAWVIHVCTCTSTKQKYEISYFWSRGPLSSSRPPKEPQIYVPGHLTCSIHLVVSVDWRAGGLDGQGGLSSDQAR